MSDPHYPITQGDAPFFIDLALAFTFALTFAIVFAIAFAAAF